MSIDDKKHNYYSTRKITLERVKLILRHAYSLQEEAPKTELSFSSIFLSCVRPLNDLDAQTMMSKEEQLNEMKFLLEELKENLTKKNLLNEDIVWPKIESVKTRTQMAEMVFRLCEKDKSGKIFLAFSDIFLKKVFLDVLKRDWATISSEATNRGSVGEQFRGRNIELDNIPNLDELDQGFFNPNSWTLPEDVESICQQKSLKDLGSQLRELNKKQMENVESFIGEKLVQVRASFFEKEKSKVVDPEAFELTYKTKPKVNLLVPSWHIDSFSNNPRLHSLEKPVYVVSYFDKKDEEGTEYVRLPYFNMGLDNIDATLRVRAIIESFLRDPGNESLIEPYIHQTQSEVVSKNLPYAFYHRSPVQKDDPVERTCLVYAEENGAAYHPFKETDLQRFVYKELDA